MATDPSTDPSTNTYAGAATNLINGALAGNLANQTSNLANNDQQGAITALNQAQASIASLLPPNLQSLAQPLSQMVFTGQQSVDQVIAAIQQQSALNGVQIDPQALEAQRQTLQQFQQVAQEGYTPIERAQIAQTMNQIQTQNKGAIGAIQQQAQAQGQGGVVNSQVAKEVAQQGADQQGALAGAQIASAGQQRAIDALSNAGTTAGNIANETTNLNVAKGTAQNAVNQFNAQLQQSASQQNAAAQNAAAAAAKAAQYNVQATNEQNQLASQGQAISAGAQDFTNQLNKANLGAQVAGKTASVDTSFGAPAQNTAFGQQQASTSHTASGIGNLIGAGTNSLFGNSPSATTSGMFGDISGNGPGANTAVDQLGSDYASTLGLSTGGPVVGPGTTKSDSIPVRLSNHEFVINAEQTEKYRPVLQAINSGADPEDVSSILDRITMKKKAPAKSGVEQLMDGE